MEWVCVSVCATVQRVERMSSVCVCERCAVCIHVRVYGVGGCVCVCVCDMVCMLQYSYISNWAVGI